MSLAEQKTHLATAVSEITHDELDLTKPEHLELFLESAEDVYADAAQYRGVAEEEAYKSLSFADVSGADVFDALFTILRNLQRLILKCHTLVEENKQRVSDTEIEKMQKLYDNMILLRDLIVETYKTKGVRTVPVIRNTTHAALGAEVELSKKDQVNQKHVLKQTERKEQPTRQQPVLSEPRKVPLVQSLAYTDQATNTGRLEAKQGLPSEAEVSMKAKSIIEDPFYTDTERAKTAELSEVFHRAVAIGEPQELIMQKYDAFSGYIDHLKIEPEIEELHKRVNRIMCRVSIGLPPDSQLLKRMRMLEQKFLAAESDPVASYESKYNAYRDLLVLARDNEREWLLVCGVRVPHPGPKGIMTARALREVLLTERDRHVDLVKDVRKQVLVDKLVRKLTILSAEGLSENTDLPEIVRLIRAIDVPGQQTRLCVSPDVSVSVDQARDAVSEEAPVMEKGLGYTQSIHKVVTIDQDNDEGLLEIQVARKASDQIVAQKVEALATVKEIREAPILPVEEESAVSVEAPIIAQTEKKDPINTVVSEIRPKITPARPVFEKQSLTKQYLGLAVYQEFIARQYTSPAAFERILDTVITQIEAKTVDIFERWLREEKTSPFVYLEKKTVAEVLQLGSRADARQLLIAENIKYETFLTWLDLIPEMQSVVEVDQRTTFGELYARWMIESEMRYYAEVHTT